MKLKKLLNKKNIDLILKSKSFWVTAIIFIFFIFLRFYQIDTRNSFGYDQVDNAWAVKAIIVDHSFPSVGMPAKANSGIYVGPAYYYYMAVFYWLTNLDPIAAGLAAGVTGIFTFWTLFYVAKKLFSNELAIIAVFIYTFLINSINFDRVQVPINFIPPLSLLIFYCLFRITQGDVKKIPWLGVLVGFFFNIHFTAVFFPLIILLSLPLFPMKKETLKYSLLSIPLFVIWILPSTITEFSRKTDYGSFSRYLSVNYHGLHLRRVIQLTGDALIQFEHYLYIRFLIPLKYIALPLFSLIYLYKSVTKEKLVFCYLILLWFIVPWFVFSMYSGEISDYYFSTNRFIVLLIISYFIFRVWKLNSLLPKAVILTLLIAFAIQNFLIFIPNRYEGVARWKTIVEKRIKMGDVIKYEQGVSESYIYYFLTKNR